MLRDYYVSVPKNFRYSAPPSVLQIKVLREYYRGGAAFVQQPSVSVHANLTDAANGAIGLLEVIILCEMLEYSYSVRCAVGIAMPCLVLAGLGLGSWSWPRPRSCPWPQFLVLALAVALALALALTLA